MQVTIKYDQGKKKEEIKVLDIPAFEFKAMIEFDYDQRLIVATDGEAITRRTPQEILDEMNREEYNSWQTHNRRKLSFQKITEEDESLIDEEEIRNYEKKEMYEAVCQRIHCSLKPNQAEMIIAICIEGMSVKEYAGIKGETITAVSNRLIRAKSILKKILSGCIEQQNGTKTKK